jgi:hypothetical protein
VPLRGGLADVEAGHRAAGDIVVRVDKEGGFCNSFNFGIGDRAGLPKRSGKASTNVYN